MSTGGDVGRAQALSHELEDSSYLFARHIELLDDLVDAQILEVLDNRGYGQTSTLEHPRAAHLAWDAFDGRALGPVKGRHCSDSLAPDYGKTPCPSRRPSKAFNLPQPAGH